MNIIQRLKVQIQNLFKIRDSKSSEIGVNAHQIGDIRFRQLGRGAIASFVISYVYVMGISILAVITMVKTKFNNHLRIGFLGVTVLVFFFLEGGHLITLIPKLIGSEGVRAAAEEVGTRHVETYSLPLTLVALALTLGLTFVLGRAVCGYGCPVGAIQELLYDIPTGKKGMHKLILPTKMTFIIRLGVLGMIVSLYLAFGLDLIQIIAPYQLWRVELVIPGLFIVIAFLVASIFAYRPFCRLFCPYGAVASLVAKFSILKLEKGNSCVSCGRCDTKCPTGELSEKYGECYLCGRCIRICNVDAIDFCYARF